MIPDRQCLIWLCSSVCLLTDAMTRTPTTKSNLSAVCRKVRMGAANKKSKSEKWKWSRSVMSDSATPWTVVHQVPPSMGFSRQEYWSGLPFPSPGESFWPRDQTQVSLITGRCFNLWATREAPKKQKGRLYLCPVLNEWMLLMAVPLISGMWWGAGSCFGVCVCVCLCVSVCLCVYKSKSLWNGRKQGSSFLIPAENKQWRGMLSSVLTL